jgi:ribosomal protein S26
MVSMVASSRFFKGYNMRNYLNIGLAGVLGIFCINTAQAVPVQGAICSTLRQMSLTEIDKLADLRQQIILWEIHIDSIGVKSVWWSSSGVKGSYVQVPTGNVTWGKDYDDIKLRSITFKGDIPKPGAALPEPGQPETMVSGTWTLTMDPKDIVKYNATLSGGGVEKKLACEIIDPAK